MNRIEKYFLLVKILALVFTTTFSLVSYSQIKKFTLVLDAGHGGHDPGAIGAISREKEINLGVVLHLGSLIEKNFNDVNVVYTRKNDKYLTLQERADIVNKNHADLFISVHTNSAKSKSAYGAETYTLGMAKSQANLDVAMKENSVILLEEDYQTKYQGFDPSSVDSYIMFEFMQDKYIDKSIDFASNVQKQFVNFGKRFDRGVRQAGFWVLHRSACPSVLVELGFISNVAEERYLASARGQREMAEAIYNAFIVYKKDHDKKMGRQNGTPAPIERTVVEISSGNPSDTTQQIAEAETATATAKGQEPVFMIQVMASKALLNGNSPQFKGLGNVAHFVENGLYKYTYGSDTDYNKIVKLRNEIKSKFPESFIIAFVGDTKMTAKDALNLLKK